ncbi:MAG: hemolysin III family protein [Oscillospiraceae bacterium]|jgi:hemolysin III|nr:hemolysin III family protein [Oscillospiraceae bacterium]
MPKHIDRSLRLQTIGEEVFNAITHGVGAALSVLGLVLLIIKAAKLQSAAAVVGVAVFGVTLFLLYLMSTLYHAMAHPGAKKVLRVFDHAMIFLLIAGTYTPFTLVSLRGAWGTALLCIIWGVAAVNVLLSAISLNRFKKVGMVSYIAMGWAIVVALPMLIAAIGWRGAGLLLAGGVFYTAGIYFYAKKTRHFSHAVWHLFVLLGSVCHFFVVFFDVV